MKAIIPKNQIKKAYPSFLDMPDFLVGADGIEPPTFCL